MASLPLLGLVVAGAVVAARSSGTIEVIDATALPEAPTVPVPTAIPTTVLSPPVASPTVPAETPAISLPTTASTAASTTRVGRFDDLPPVAPPVVPATTPVPASGPQTADDCKDDGWRRWLDDEHQPFANQGQCIAFVQGRRQHPG